MPHDEYDHLRSDADQMVIANTPQTPGELAEYLLDFCMGSKVEAIYMAGDIPELDLRVKTIAALEKMEEVN